MMSEALDIAARETVIREGTTADLNACARIVNDFIDATDWLPRIHSREAITAMFSPDVLERRRLFVAEAEGRVCGYLSLSGKPGSKGFVEAIYLAPEVQGAGTGKAFIDRAKRLYPAQLELTVYEPNVRAQRFYEREGFAEVPEGREENAEEGVGKKLMRWRGGA